MPRAALIKTGRFLRAAWKILWPVLRSTLIWTLRVAWFFLNLAWALIGGILLFLFEPKKHAQRRKKQSGRNRTRSDYRDVGPHGGWITELAGSSHENTDGTSRQALLGKCREGEELILVRDPLNPYDRHAIIVLRKNGAQIGFIRAEVAQPPSGGGLASDMDNGVRPRCWLLKFQGGTARKPTLSAALEVLE